MKSKKVLSFSLVLILLSLILCISGLFLTKTQQVMAAGATYTDIFKGYSDNLSEQELYNATNNYTYVGNPTDENNDSYYNVSLSGRNNLTISDQAPQITVLTHGLGGRASNWSNNGNNTFALNENSIIEKLRKHASVSTNQAPNIYWAKFEKNNLDPSKSDFYLIDLNDSSNISNKIYSKNVTVEKITDITKPIILIFETINNSASNNQVYEELNYAISKVVYDVARVSEQLPRINLIGHSRGGITNLQYALDHPNLVDGLFSLGTPYFGSNTASTELGKEIAGGESAGLTDIITRSTYMKYFNRWKNNQVLYENINAHALGGYSNTDFLFDTLIEDNDFVEDYISDAGLTAIKWGVKSLTGLLKTLLRDNAMLNFVTRIWHSGDYQESQFESIVQILNDIDYIDFNNDFWTNVVANTPIAGSPFFKSDLLVPLSSQIAKDNTGLNLNNYQFKTYSKYFTPKNCIKTNLSRYDMPAVIHNMEARDADFINYILHNISIGTSSTTFRYATHDIGDKISIDGYYGHLGSNTFEIPETINGKTVVAIGKSAFIKNFYGQDIIETVKIPKNIALISENAFDNCTDLQHVYFASDSQLTNISANAFAGCTNLKTFSCNENVTNVFNAPNELAVIEEQAFCNTGITQLNLGANINKIGFGAFAYCKNLTSIAVVDNAFFATESGVLYNKSKTELITYPSGKNTSTFMVDASVRTIQDLAFSGNKYLTNINLNNAQVIGQQAFENCTNLSQVVGFHVSEASYSDFDGTKWATNNKNNTVILGKALLQYMGTKSVLTEDDFRYGGSYIEYIGDGAFIGNYSVTQITFPYQLDNIGDFAFSDCSILSEVSVLAPHADFGMYAFNNCNKLNNVYFHTEYVYNGEEKVFGDVFTGNIVVQGIVLEDYRKNPIWEHYADNFTTKKINITLINRGEDYSNVEFIWGGKIDNLPTGEEMEAHNVDQYGAEYAMYELLYWEGSDGEKYANGNVYGAFVDGMTLTAVYSEKEYFTIEFDSKEGSIRFIDQNGESCIQSIVYDPDGIVQINLPQNIPGGHYFVGWYSEEENKYYTDENGVSLVTWEEWDALAGKLIKDSYGGILIPKYEPYKITIEYDLNDGMVDPLNNIEYQTYYEASRSNTNSVTVKDYIPIQKGWKFISWTNKGQEVTTVDYRNAVLSGHTGMISLSSKWEKLNATTKGFNASNPTTDLYAYFDLTSKSIYDTLELHVGETTNYVTFVGDPNKTYKGLSITIDTRWKEDVVIFLDNIKYDAPYSKDGLTIITNSTSDLNAYIVASGENRITAGDGATTTSWGLSGLYLRYGNIHVLGNGSIFAKGGAGKMGASGSSGSGGSGDGGVGGNGSNGATGGVGGHGIRCANLTISCSGNVYAYGGDGGKGGTGGTGGSGTKGYTSNLMPGDGGVGGTGGQGGSGGKGGAGGFGVMTGSVIATDTARNIYFGGGDGGVGGTGGNGGSGGAGGDGRGGGWFTGSGNTGGTGGVGGAAGNGGDGTIYQCSNMQISEKCVLRLFGGAGGNGGNGGNGGRGGNGGVNAPGTFALGNVGAGGYGGDSGRFGDGGKNADGTTDSWKKGDWGKIGARGTTPAQVQH